MNDPGMSTSQRIELLTFMYTYGVEYNPEWSFGHAERLLQIYRNRYGFVDKNIEEDDSDEYI